MRFFGTVVSFNAINEVERGDGVRDEVIGARLNLVVSALIDTVLAGKGPRIT